MILNKLLFKNGVVPSMAFHSFQQQMLLGSAYSRFFSTPVKAKKVNKKPSAKNVTIETETVDTKQANDDVKVVH